MRVLQRSAFQPPPQIISAAYQEQEDKNSVIEDQVINKNLHHPHEIGPQEIYGSGQPAKRKKDFDVQLIGLI